MNKINNNDQNLLKVLIKLEKEEKLDYNLSTYADIKNVSLFPIKREVLFFPFSSFEIINIDDAKTPIEI